MLLPRSADYTMIWNVLDYAALTIPVSNCKVDKSIDVKKPRETFLNDRDKTNHELCEFLANALCARTQYPTTDDPSVFENTPIAIQLIGRTQEEEAVIGMAEIVDAAIKKQI
jgi:amidase